MKKIRQSILAVALVVLLGTAGNIVLLAEDWPQWRGVNRDGKSQETGLLKAWPGGGPKLVWKAENLGTGYSTPSVAEGKVFGLGYRGGDEVVWALDEKTGRELWSAETMKAFRGMGYSEGPRSSPTVDGIAVYTLGAGGNLVCLSVEDGDILWERRFKDEFGGRMMSGWGFSESVLVDGDRLVCTPGAVRGTVMALNKKSGEMIWQSKELRDKAAYASLLAVEHGGVRQYVVLTDDSVAGVEAETGELLWKAERSGRTAVIPTPIFHDRRVYVTSGYGVGCNQFEVGTSQGGFQVEEKYSNKVMVNHHGGVILLGDHVYGYSDGDGWICQDFLTGKEVWRHEGVGKGSISYADGHFYLRSERSKGTVALIEATSTGYVEKGRFDQPDRSRKNSWPHPVIANGRLLLRDQEILLVYDLKE